MHKALELFSGAGGLAKGLELSGFEHTAFVELNRDACSTLRLNYPAEIVHEIDIRKFFFESISSVDIIAGGPPCQPFSLGGKHRGVADDRDMFPSAIRAIALLMPRVFVFENVKGLMRASFSEYFEYIIRRLQHPSHGNADYHSWNDHLQALRSSQEGDGANSIEYDVKYKLINSADYGVPQSRERVVIVGTRVDLSARWAFPLPTHSKDRLLWDKYVTNDYWERNRVSTTDIAPICAVGRNVRERLVRKYGFIEPKRLPWVTVREAIDDLPDPRTVNNVLDHDFRGGARSYPGHTGSDYDLPSKTIKAGGHGVPGGENMIRYPDGSIRYYTVLEAKRIQTFPDGYRIQGAWGEAMRQIGNAVPVKLATVLGASIFSYLNAENSYAESADQAVCI
jgi:DNA (cytosine-5)-methyltransferase 1